MKGDLKKMEKIESLSFSLCPKGEVNKTGFDHVLIH